MVYFHLFPASPPNHATVNLCKSCAPRHHLGTRTVGPCTGLALLTISLDSSWPGPGTSAQKRTFNRDVISKFRGGQLACFCFAFTKGYKSWFWFTRNVHDQCQILLSKKPCRICRPIPVVPSNFTIKLKLVIILLTNGTFSLSSTISF